MSLLGFNFEEFLADDAHNRVGSMKNLKPHWDHFQTVASFYQGVRSGIDFELLQTDANRACFYALSSCWVNLIKANSNIIAGHLSDSVIYARRTLEAVKHSIFLREKPEDGPLWFQTIKDTHKFDDAYKKWLRGGGSTTVQKEYPIDAVYWGTANNLGAHTNFTLAIHQNKVESVDDTHTFKLFFHELEPGEKGFCYLMHFYFWHLKVHYATIDWWVDHSGLNLKMTSDQRSYWREQKSKLEKAIHDMQPRFQRYENIFARY